GVGYADSTYQAERSFYQMAVPSAVAGSTVLSATFAGQVAHAGSSASTSHTVKLYSATSTISSATTWNTMPAHSASPSATSTFATDGNLYTSSTKPVFGAVSTDADGDSISYQWQILSGSTVIASATTGAITSGTAASWPDPTALANGSTYTEQVRGFDGTEYG